MLMVVSTLRLLTKIRVHVVDREVHKEKNALPGEYQQSVIRTWALGADRMKPCEFHPGPHLENLDMQSWLDVIANVSRLGILLNGEIENRISPPDWLYSFAEQTTESASHTPLLSLDHCPRWQSPKTRTDDLEVLPRPRSHSVH